jgi:hypothetical protein
MYDVDSSDVKFTDSVDIEIPYNQSLLPPSYSGTEVRFMHYDGNHWEDVTSSVNATANTVSGTLNSTSPVLPAVIVDTYFELDPITKIVIMNVTAGSGESDSAGAVHVTISTFIRNGQEEKQAYTEAIQVVDSQGIVQSISWVTGSLEQNATAPTIATIVLPDSQTYKVVVFVWDGIDDPEPLSTPRVISLKT